MQIENQMASMLYQLSLCIVAIIQLTSSQSTCGNDVSGCGDSEQALNQLMMMNSELMKAVAHLTKAVSQLQKDVTELKAGSRQKDARGIKSIGLCCPR